MKKSLLAVIVGAFAFAFAFASVANANIYAEGDIGLSQTKANGSNNTRVEPRVSVGYKVGNTRVAGDYTHHGKVDGTKNSRFRCISII